MRYRAKGKLTIRVGGVLRHFRSDDVFTAEPAEIPKGFADKVEALDPPPPPPEAEPARVGLLVQYRGGGWFDVVNPISGKVLNTQALRRDEAEELVEKLETDEGDTDA